MEGYGSGSVPLTNGSGSILLMTDSIERFCNITGFPLTAKTTSAYILNKKYRIFVKFM